MKLLIHKNSKAILDTSDTEKWTVQVPAFAKIIEVSGNAETFKWPHPNGPSSCIWGGTAIIANPKVANEKYKDDRRTAYGPVEDQLDMIYEDQVNGTTTWRDHVAAVRAAHPKPVKE